MTSKKWLRFFCYFLALLIPQLLKSQGYINVVWTFILSIILCMIIGKVLK